MVPGQTIVPYDAGAVEPRQGETWESAHVDLVGPLARRRADRIVVSELDVRQMLVPIVLSLVDDHSQHLGHGLVHQLNAPVTVGMLGACSKLAHVQQLIYSLWKHGAELEAIVREYGARAPLQGNALVHQDIGCTLRRGLSSSDWKNVGPRLKRPLNRYCLVALSEGGRSSHY